MRSCNLLRIVRVVVLLFLMTGLVILRAYPGTSVTPIKADAAIGACETR
jgi:hypothetical protein